MPDFDATVALGARGYDPQDAVAPLQAYMLAAQGRNLDAEATGRNISNQLSQLSLSSRQNLAKGLATPGSDPQNALSASGLGAYDPDAAKSVLSNIQAGNTLGALKNYAANPSNPNSLAMAGPSAVGEASTAQNTQAQTAGVDQDTLAKKVNIRGQIALGYMTAVQKAQTKDEADLAWHQAATQAHALGVVSPLGLQHGIDNITDPGERMALARSWAAAGASSVVNSGTSAGNETREKNLNDVFPVPMGSGLYAGPDLQNQMFNSTPAAQQTPTAGRSVATDGPVPVAPASGNGSRPVAGGYLGNGGVPPQRQQADRGWVDIATPEQMSQAPGARAQPIMTRAEQTYGLPTNYLSRTAQIESGGRANASNPSGAAGLFQFMPSTWARYGDPGTSPLNPQAATVAAARLAADNSATLTKALGRPPTGAELYLAHQQGAGGAAALLSNPNAPAASIVGAKAVISNGGTPNMTAGQFAAMWENKFNRAGNSGNFSLSGPSPMGPGVSMPENPASTFPGTGGVGLRAAAPATSSPSQPDLAPPVAGPIPLPTSTQPMPTAPSAATMGRSASDEAPTPPTRQLAQGFTPLVKGMSPFEFEKQHWDAARAVDEEKSARDGFVAANTAQSGLMQLSEDFAKLDPDKSQNLRDTLLSQGSGAETRIGLAKTVNSVLASAGMPPLFDQDKIAAAESANKVTGRLGFDLAEGLGKGQAGFIVNGAIGLNPGVMNTPAGGKLLIGSLLAAQQRQKDFYLFQQQYKENNGGNPLNAETEFDLNRPPMTYVQDAQRLARVPLQSVKLLQAHSNNQAAITIFNKTYGPGLARYYIGSKTDY